MEEKSFLLAALIKNTMKKKTILLVVLVRNTMEEKSLLLAALVRNTMEQESGSCGYKGWRDDEFLWKQEDSCSKDLRQAPLSYIRNGPGTGSLPAAPSNLVVHKKG